VAYKKGENLKPTYTRRVNIYFVVVLVNIFDVFLVLKHNKTKLCSSKYKLNYFSSGVPYSMCRDAFPLLSQRFVV